MSHCQSQRKSIYIGINAQNLCLISPDTIGFTMDHACAIRILKDPVPANILPEY